MTVIQFEGKDLIARTMTWKEKKEFKRLVMVISSKNTKINDTYKELGKDPAADLGEVLGQMAVATDAYQEAVLIMAYGLTQEQLEGLPATTVEQLVLNFLEANPVIELTEGDGGKKDLTTALLRLAKK